MRLAGSLTGSQVLTACRSGTEWIEFSSLVASTSQCGAPTCQQATAPWLSSGAAAQQVRHFAKASAKGRAAPPPVEPAKPKVPTQSEKARSEAHLLLKEREMKLPPILRGVTQSGREVVDPRKWKRDVPIPELDKLAVSDVALMVHESMKAIDGSGDFQLNMFEFGGPLQSATVAAGEVADSLECGFSWGRITQYYTRMMPDYPYVKGLKIQIKGRLSAKAGKASHKVFELGQVTSATFTEAVDYAEASSLTRAGWIGVKVWIRYAPGAVPDGYRKRLPSTEPMTLQDLLSAPRTPIPRTPSAWWSLPGPLQPAHCGAARSWRADNDPTHRPADDNQDPLLS